MFLFPDGTHSSLQQSVHEPAGSTWATLHAREHEPGQHGGQHEWPQHKRCPHEHEPAAGGLRHEPLRKPRSAHAAAGLPGPPATVHTHAEHEEVLHWGGQYAYYGEEGSRQASYARDLMSGLTGYCQPLRVSQHVSVLVFLHTCHLPLPKEQKCRGR